MDYQPPQLTVIDHGANDFKKAKRKIIFTVTLLCFAISVFVLVIYDQLKQRLKVKPVSIPKPLKKVQKAPIVETLETLEVIEVETTTTEVENVDEAEQNNLKIVE